MGLFPRDLFLVNKYETLRMEYLLENEKEMDKDLVKKYKKEIF